MSWEGGQPAAEHMGGARGVHVLSFAVVCGFDYYNTRSRSEAKKFNKSILTISLCVCIHFI